MAQSEQQIKTDISQIFGHFRKRDIKYIRNMNRFLNNGNMLSDIYDNYGPVNAYWYQTSQQDTGLLPNLNVIRSAALTHQSKLSQLKPRPHFTAERGDFETRQLCRVARQHFDYFLDKQDVYNKGAQAILFADIFEFGALWVCDDTETIEILRPWEIYFDSMEYSTGELTRCFVYFRQYPLNKIEKKFLKGKANKGSAALIPDDQRRSKRVEFIVYYDLQEGKKYYLVNNDIQKTVKIEYEIPPWALFWYDRPIRGSMSVCMADNLYPIQREIDSISQRVHEAFQLSPANTILLATSDNINNPSHKLLRAESITNRIGDVLEFNPAENTARPVTVATPPAIDEQYIRMIDFWIAYAYKQEGISQLSAQSEKPIGADSGVSLETLQNVESERFQTHQDNYRQFFLDIVNACIQVYPKSEKILKFLNKGSLLTWGKLREKIDEFSIQFTDVSNLSKDPAVKLQQIEKMLAMGFIQGDTAAAMMEVEDEDNAFAIATVSYEYTQKVISDALNYGKIDFMELGSYDQLFSEITKELMRLKIDEAPDEQLKNMGKLLNAVFAKMNAAKETMKGQQYDQASEGQVIGASLQAKQNEIQSKLQEQTQELNAPVAAKGMQIQNALQAQQQEDQAPLNQRGQELQDALKAAQAQGQPVNGTTQAPTVQGPTGPIPLQSQPQPLTKGAAVQPSAPPAVHVYLPSTKSKKRHKVTIARDETGKMVGADVEETPTEE